MSQARRTRSRVSRACVDLLAILGGRSNAVRRFGVHIIIVSSLSTLPALP